MPTLKKNINNDEVARFNIDSNNNIKFTKKLKKLKN